MQSKLRVQKLYATLLISIQRKKCPLYQKIRVWKCMFLHWELTAWGHSLIWLGRRNLNPHFQTTREKLCKNLSICHKLIPDTKNLLKCNQPIVFAVLHRVIADLTLNENQNLARFRQIRKTTFYQPNKNTHVKTKHVKTIQIFI